MSEIISTKQMTITLVEKSDGSHTIAVHNEIPFYSVKPVLKEVLEYIVKDQYPDAPELTIKELSKL